MNEDYRQGFVDGFKAGVLGSDFDLVELEKSQNERKMKPFKAKRKVKRSSSAKLLDKMTKPIWDKYKKGRGKKTYVQIRAQVSRSQKYKRAVKRL